MRNRYLDATPGNTVLAAQQILSVVGDEPTIWGLTPALMSALSGITTALEAGNGNVVATREAARAATQARAGQDRSCKRAIANIASAVYADKNLTPSQIARLGFQPRKTTKTKVVPVTPTDLVASIERNGNVLLKFKRAGNAAGVIFRVEAQTAAGGPWAFATESTATRLSLQGYAPGEWTAFRIVATKNGIDAPPSDVAVIYPASLGASATPALRLAA